MRLPSPPPRYDPAAETRRNSILELAINRAFVSGADSEIGVGRLILTSPNGTRYALAVSNAGALSAVPV